LFCFRPTGQFSGDLVTEILDLPSSVLFVLIPFVIIGLTWLASKV
jgi:hypothetical protein